ncbi:unnamed protein product, partial [Musa hybrid cultivar]
IVSISIHPSLQSSSFLPSSAFLYSSASCFVFCRRRWRGWARLLWESAVALLGWSEPEEEEGGPTFFRTPK